MQTIKRAFIFTISAIILVSVYSVYRNSSGGEIFSNGLNIVGMWESSNGTIISFGSNGVCSPSLFGFDGGPNGTYMLSGDADQNGNYTLQTSHITRGEVIYKNCVVNADQIELDLTSEQYFSASHLSLTRQ